MRRRLAQAVLVLLGVYSCLLATIVHRHTVSVAGAELPWGMLIGFVAAYSIVRSTQAWARRGDLFFSLGWMAGLAFATWSPGPGYLIAQDWLGLGFAFGGLAVLALAIVRAPLAQ